MFDEHANHVLQRCVQKIRKQDLFQSILIQCRGKVVELAKDINGCRIVQRILERFEHQEIDFILDEVFAGLLELRSDIYGNYVVSHVLEFGTEKEKERIVIACIDNLIDLSLHKFGSNVVEKCLQYAPDPLKLLLLDRIASVTPL